MRLVDGSVRVAASDLSNFLACRHLTSLDLAAAHGLAEAPYYSDLGGQALADRGMEHEAAVLDTLSDRGWEIVELQVGDGEWTTRATATVDAIREGVDGIYQGTLLVERRIGLPDFLIRSDLLGSAEGEPSYEVVDAKLARSAKARAVIQAAFYSALLGEIQNHPPHNMYLALGGQDLVKLRVADYAAYGRQVGGLLESALLDTPPAFPPGHTYPEPVEHCAVCRWRPLCQQKRGDDDDLSLVAGMTARQRKILKLAGVSTRRGFASLGEVPRFYRVSAQSMTKAHAQARLQVLGEDSGRVLWEFVDPQRTEDGGLVTNRGLTALPPPAPGDLFFDIEGARYYSEDGKEYGLQYLFGVVDTADQDADGRPRYHAFWSFDRAGERRAFQELVDFIVERRTRNPELHVYHYNHYEPTALDHLSELHETREDVVGRLMGRFATREDEVDHLFRRRVFVDLYRVVRQGIRASVESYSLKRVECLYEFQRAVNLDDVTERMLRFELALDGGAATSDLDAQREIAGYNEDDCRSTLELRDWLENRRDELAQTLGDGLPRATPLYEDEPDVEPEVRALLDALRADLPEDGRTAEQEGSALMADLLEWHRRDAKPGWWRFFRLHDLTDEELLSEADALAGLEVEGVVGEVKRSEIVRYRFTPQEHPFRDGDQAIDPRSGKGWTIQAIDEASGSLDLRRGRSSTNPDPTVLIEPGPINTTAHRARLRDLAARVAGMGLRRWDAGPQYDLLLRRAPSIEGQRGGELRREGEGVVDACRRLAIAMRDSHLAVQGPPGSGKTYSGAMQVLDLVAAGRRVGVTATSHAVIRNLLNEIAEHNPLGRDIHIGQRPDGAEAFASRRATIFKQPEAALAALAAGDVEVLGGTTWLWARDDARDSVDVLVVDEAGQMSLANVLAASHGARNVILLGDPLQLGQPSAAAHPPGAGVSALDRVLGEQATMPSDRGLFIDHTRRMHPDVCAFTSEVFYEDRLASLPELGNQAVLPGGRFSGTGPRIVDVPHEGNDNSSPEEAQVVAELVGDLRVQAWRNADGEVDTIGLKGILVVSPFNAQISEIERALRDAGIVGARVGTVDKFQGQQAPVVIYSMASSTAEDAPRGMEFLYDLRRLNVATSRARCLAILVSSPELCRVFCRTPRQILLANALCRFREMAAG